MCVRSRQTTRLAFALLLCVAHVRPESAPAREFLLKCYEVARSLVPWGLNKEPDRPKIPVAPVALAPSIPWKPGPVKSLQLGEKIGSGGFGDVFEATLTFDDGTPPMTVYVKTIHKVREDQRGPILNIEATAMNRVQPGQGFVFQDKDWFLVQKPFSRTTLEKFIAGDDTTRQKLARTILENTLVATDAVHKAGLSHNDLNPRNILVNEEGEVLILDFYQARKLGDPDEEMSGTPQYIHPLRWMDETPNPAHDLYGIGQSMLELELPGVFKRDPANRYSVIRKIVGGGGQWDSPGRVPDNSPKIAAERAMAHLTVVKRDVESYRRLLKAAPSRSAFVKEYAAQWVAMHKMAVETKNEDLEQLLVYDVFSAPALGPELWKGIPDAALRRKILEIGVTKRNQIAGKHIRGYVPMFGWYMGMAPEIDEFLANPLVRNDRALRALDVPVLPIPK